MRDNPEYSRLPVVATASTVSNRYTGDIINSSSGVYDPTLQNGGYSWYRSYVSSSTPGYASIKRKKRNLPLHGHSVTIKKDIDGGYSQSTSANGFLQVSSGSSFQLDAFRPRQIYDPRDEIEEADLRAIQRLSKKLTGARANVALMFKERHQTVQLLLSTVTRVRAAATALKRGRLGDLYVALGLRHTPSVKEAERVLSTPKNLRLANHWLEYTFGWKPLLQDVHDAAELVASHAVGDFYHEAASASARVGIDRSVGNAAFKGTVVGDAFVRYSIAYRLESYARAALAQTGITNPLALAWEALPFSFVVDWFLPVGNYLESLTQFDGFELVNGTRAIQVNLLLSKDFSYHHEGGGAYDDDFEHRGGSQLLRDFTYTRSLMSSFPSSVPPKFRSPVQGDALWKFTTSWALLRQVFENKSR